MEIVILPLIVAIILIVGPICFLILNLLFSPLNYIQWIIHRPWRWLAMRPADANRGMYLLTFPVRMFCLAFFYFVSLPLRFVNAVYYNLGVYNLWNIRDDVSELLNPKRRGYRHMSNAGYGPMWLVGFPRGLVTCILRIGLSFLDSIAMTIVDMVFPALTMYHGTSFDAAAKIAQDGWLIGGGNYAGTGLYFAMSRNVAAHYSRGQEVVVCVRVTLGINYPLSCAPRRIRDAIARDGDSITSWGRLTGIASVEHWRPDEQWWEYCLLRHPQTATLKTWRVRPLFVVPVSGFYPQRVWGGTYFWLSQLSSWLALGTAIAALILFANLTE